MPHGQRRPIDGKQYLSEELARGLTGKPRRKWPDANMVVPMPFHLGYHESPVPGLLNGFGHVGLGGTLGWADPETASAFGFVHNRLLTPLLFDMGSFAGLARPLRNAILAARHQGPSRCRSSVRPTPNPLGGGRWSTEKAVSGDAWPLQATCDERCGLSRHPGLNVGGMRQSVNAAGARRIAGSAQVDRVFAR